MKTWILSFLLFPLPLLAAPNTIDDTPEPYHLHTNSTLTADEDNLKFLESLAFSECTFVTVNTVLLRNQLLAGQIGFKHILGISSFEIAKNLINFVDIEINSNFLGPVLIYMWLNYMRMELPTQQSNRRILTLLEIALAEWIKNKVNYEVTENWYPRKWLPASHCTTK